VDLDIPHEGRVSADAVLFVPTVFTDRAFHAIDADDAPGRRPPQVNHPALLVCQERTRAIDDLVGATRAQILAELAAPISTREVARRLRLAPSTVSYHLQILHRSGLAHRIRRRRSVLYQRATAAPQGG
jgi:DNA-binding transcriptional ArsR family regulator